MWGAAHAVAKHACCSPACLCRVEVVGFMLKMFMTTVSVFVTNLKWMSIMQVVASAYLAWIYFKWLPFMHSVVNYIRVASYASVFYAALLLNFVVFRPGKDKGDAAGIADLRWGSQ